MKSDLLHRIDEYYFGELLADVHPDLRAIAVDKRMLHLHKEPEAITSLAAVFSESYILMPYQCADIIRISDPALEAISLAYVAHLVAYLMLDQLVDRQMPDSLRLAPLIYSHFLIAARRQYAVAFSAGSPFDALFDAYMRESFDGLAAESASLDGHDPLYTEPVMQQVCHAKCASFRLAARLMAEVAGDPQGGALCEAMIDTLFYGDQLRDDVLDWQPDLAMGRITHLHVRLMEIAGLSAVELQARPIPDLQALIDANQLDIHLMEQTRAIYQAGRERLRKAGYENSRWDAILAERITRSEGSRRRLAAGSLLSGLASRLRGGTQRSM